MDKRFHINIVLTSLMINLNKRSICITIDFIQILKGQFLLNERNVYYVIEMIFIERVLVKNRGIVLLVGFVFGWSSGGVV